MPNKIITIEGEYQKQSFKGPNGTWNLVATEGDGKAMHCIDTFKNPSNGLYKSIPRQDVYNSAEAGIIH